MHFYLHKGSKEIHNVWHRTGYKGWWTFKHAVAALRRAKKMDSEGAFDSRSLEGKFQQAVRHDFRIVKMIVSQKTEVVTIPAKEQP